MNLLVASSLFIALAGADVPPATVAAIGAGYSGPVKQAFERHCADCHGQMPAALAEPARGVAEKKRGKAHKRLDMDEGFPFGSKWELPKLMTEIRKAVGKDDMPPPKYTKQKGVAPTEEERRAIVEWATAAEQQLKPAP